MPVGTIGRVRFGCGDTAIAQRWSSPQCIGVSEMTEDVQRDRALSPEIEALCRILAAVVARLLRERPVEKKAA